MSDATPAATVVPMMAPAPGGNPPVALATPAPAAPVVPAAVAEPVKSAEPAPVVAAPKRLITDDAAPVVPAKPAEPVKPVVADWKLEAPKDSPVSAHEITALEAQAKKLGLPKEQAESFVAFRAEQIQAEVSRTNDAWFEQSMADTEIGGDKMPATMVNVKKSMAALLTPEERKAVANSPFANNTMFLRLMNRAAAFLPTEDKTAISATPGSSSYPTNPDEAAKAMYGRYNK